MVWLDAGESSVARWLVAELEERLADLADISPSELRGGESLSDLGIDSLLLALLADEMGAFLAIDEVPVEELMSAGSVHELAAIFIERAQLTDEDIRPLS